MPRAQTQLAWHGADVRVARCLLRASRAGARAVGTHLPRCVVRSRDAAARRSMLTCQALRRALSTSCAASALQPTHAPLSASQRAAAAWHPAPSSLASIRCLRKGSCGLLFWGEAGLGGERGVCKGRRARGRRRGAPAVCASRLPAHKAHGGGAVRGSVLRCQDAGDEQARAPRVPAQRWRRAAGPLPAATQARQPGASAPGCGVGACARQRGGETSPGPRAPARGAALRRWPRRLLGRAPTGCSCRPGASPGLPDAPVALQQVRPACVRARAAP
jgi:hypothetical protein